MASFQHRAFSKEYLNSLYSQEEVFFDEIELEEMEYDNQKKVFYYPCPCGDKFVIELDEMFLGENKATCPSCSLILRVSYDKKDLEKYLL